MTGLKIGGSFWEDGEEGDGLPLKEGRDVLDEDGEAGDDWIEDGLEEDAVWGLGVGLEEDFGGSGEDVAGLRELEG